MGLRRTSSSSSPCACVARMAAISRLVILILVIVFDYIAVDYDTSAHLDSPCLLAQRESEGRLGEAGGLREEERLGEGGSEDGGEERGLPMILLPLRSPSSSSSSSSSPLSLAVNVSESRWWPIERMRLAFEGAITWDSVFFVRIARCGYEYEQMHAFLPLFPLLMRAVRLTVLRPLVHAIGERATLVLAGYLINSTAFILAAVFLFRLTSEVLSDEEQAFRAVSLFCYNPASIFYFSLYTESLFAVFVFAGLFYLVKGATWRATVLFGLSSLTRSNGVLNCGFFLFQSCHIVIRSFYRRNQPKQTLKAVVEGILQAVATLAPFVIFQWYGYLEYCKHSGNDGTRQRPWCTSKVPYLYGFVQSYYWNVGFLKYFELKQLPNFLLASPMLMLSLSAIVSYIRHNPKLCASLGFCTTDDEYTLLIWQHPASRHYIETVEKAQRHLSKSNAAVAGATDELRSLRRRLGKDSSISISDEATMPSAQGEQGGWNHAHDKELKFADQETMARNETSSGFYSPGVLCFICQLGFMVFVCVCIMHVQVATRFLASHPVVYWYGAMMTWKGARSRQNKSESSELKQADASMPEGQTTRVGRILLTVFLCYVFVGTLLFTNFYPFT